MFSLSFRVSSCCVSSHLTHLLFAWKHVLLMLDMYSRVHLIFHSVLDGTKQNHRNWNKRSLLCWCEMREWQGLVVCDLLCSYACCRWIKIKCFFLSFRFDVDGKTEQTRSFIMWCMGWTTANKSLQSFAAFFSHISISPLNGDASQSLEAFVNRTILQLCTHIEFIIKREI